MNNFDLPTTKNSFSDHVRISQKNITGERIFRSYTTHHFLKIYQYRNAIKLQRVTHFLPTTR